MGSLLATSSTLLAAHLLLPASRFIEAPPGNIKEEQLVCQQRLVLNFDINKTIIMSDAAQGSDLDAMINSLLGDCAWGRLEPGPVWVPVGRLATDRSAASSTCS